MSLITTALLTILLFPGTVLGQKGLGQGAIQEIAVEDAGYEGMRYHVFTPKSTKRGQLYPLVFALHGNGGSSKGHAGNIGKVSSSDLPVFVVAPGYQKEKKFNAPVYPGAGKIFDTILDTVLTKHPIDKSRVILQGFSTDQKSKSRTLRGKIQRHLKKFVDAAGKRKPSTIAVFEELSRLATILANDKALSKSLKSKLDKLEKGEKFSIELAAWRDFEIGRKAAGEDWIWSLAAIKSVADGPHKDTWFGLRAQSHLQALGERYPSPYSKGGGNRKGAKKKR